MARTIQILILFLSFNNVLFGKDDAQLRKLVASKLTTIRLPNKTYLLAEKLIIPSGKSIDGNGAKLVFLNPNNKQWMLELKSNTTIRNITIEPASSNDVFDYTINGAEKYRRFNFNYNKAFLAIWCSGIKINLDNVKVASGFKGLGGNVNGLTITRCDFTGGYAAIELYISKNITITHSDFKGGDFAGIAFPSCSTIKVNHCRIINPKSTGINPGGAADLSMTPFGMEFRNNSIIAGDCINLENGAMNADIFDNTIQCAPIVNKSINNSAIGVVVHNPNANSVVRNIKIYNNHISAYENIMYGIGINVGNFVGNEVRDIVIRNNQISGANEGIRVHNKSSYTASNVTVENNTMQTMAFGMRFYNLNNSTVRGNSAKTFYSSWNNDLWGIQIDQCKNTKFDNNKTEGFAKHYYQTSDAQNVEISKPNILQGEFKGKPDHLFTSPKVQQHQKINLR